MNKRQRKKRIKKVIARNCATWSKFLSECTGQSICIDPRGVIVNPIMIHIKDGVESTMLWGEWVGES